MDRASVMDLVNDFYRDRLANDVTACLDHLTPDVSLRIAGSPTASPIAGSSHDRNLRRHMTELVENWEWRSMNVHSLTIDGDRAAVQP